MLIRRRDRERDLRAVDTVNNARMESERVVDEESKTKSESENDRTWAAAAASASGCSGAVPGRRRPPFPPLVLAMVISLSRNSK